jgi:hypothetical protein
MSQPPDFFSKMFVAKLVLLWSTPALSLLSPYSMPLTHAMEPLIELSPNFGDGVRDQAAAWA